MSTQATKTASGVTATTTAETAIVTSDNIPYSTWQASGPFEGVEIRGVLSVLTGTACTAVTVTVRRGAGTGGTIVGAARVHTIGAAVNGQIAFCELDSAPNAAGQQYTVTATQTAATGNATVSGTLTTSPSSSVSG
jgi:hypothetical protein